MTNFGSYENWIEPVRIRRLLWVLAFAVTFGGEIQTVGAFEVGVGLSSSYSGRYAPALSAGINLGSWVLSGSTAGVQTTVYYHSSYTLGIYSVFPIGEVMGGPLAGGMGLAGEHSERGYRPSSTADLERKIDSVAGPAFRLRWHALGSGYLGLDWIFGIRSLGYLLALANQDVVLFTIGFAL